MNRIYLVVGSTVVVSGAVCLWGQAISPSQGQSRLKRSLSEGDDSGLATPLPQARGHDELQRLLAEPGENAVPILVPSKHSRVADQTQPSALQPPESGHTVGAAQACDALDERLLGSSADARSTAEMEREIRAIANAKMLGRVQIDSLRCGGTMCKLNLVGGSEEAINGAVRALAAQSPKLFASLLVLPNGDTNRAIYFARDGDDLKIEEGE